MSRFRRRYVLLALLATGAALLAVALSRPAGASAPGLRTGGTFRIVMVPGNFDFIDPAMAYTTGAWRVIDATCARLMRYPDRKPPGGFRLRPEVATAYPRVTNNAKTFTFTLRPGYRFSDGKPVTAAAFARAINRTLSPQLGDFNAGTVHTGDIVGADAVMAGKRTSAAGVVVRGRYRLVVTLKHSTPDFPARTTMPFFCAVPPNLPVFPEGARAPLHAAGPYYISEYVPDRRVVLKRNRYYPRNGPRPHRVDGFVVDLTAASDDDAIRRVEAGRAHSMVALVPPTYFLAGLDRKYGVNRSQFWVNPGLGLRAYAFNTARPLFRDARLRRAVNLAVDRRAIQGAFPGGRRASRLTDQYLPPGLPAFRDAKIYRLAGPRLATAKKLARGRPRNARAAIYVPAVAPMIAAAQVIARALGKLGIKADVTRTPPGAAYYQRVGTAGEPWDIAFWGWAPDYVDPYAYLNALLDGRFAGSANVGRFDVPRYNARLRRAARLRGEARTAAYRALDARLAREAAPLLAVDFLNEPTFVSKRVDRRCLVLRPALDLTAVCLK